MNFEMAPNNLEFDFEQSLLIFSNSQMIFRMIEIQFNYFDKKIFRITKGYIYK